MSVEKEGEYGEDGDHGGGHGGGEGEVEEGENIYMVYKETIDDLKAGRCVLTINKPSSLEPSA